MSLRSFWEAAWRLLEPRESTYGPSQKTSGRESSSSDLFMALLGLPTDPSFHEWLFSTAATPFLSLCLPSLSHPNAPAHTPSLDYSSLVVSSVSVPLGNTLHDLWLGKHLTKCILFQIWDYILLFQYLGASEQPWLLRSSWPNIPIHLRRAQARATTESQWKAAQRRQTRSSASDCALHGSFCKAGYVNKPFEVEGRLPPAIRGEDVRWTTVCTDLLCLSLVVNVYVSSKFNEISSGAVSVMQLMDVMQFDWWYINQAIYLHFHFFQRPALIQNIIGTIGACALAKIISQVLTWTRRDGV